MSRIDELITKHCPDGVIRKTLSDVAKLERGTSITKKQVTDGNIPVVAGGRTAAYLHGEFNRDGESIVVAGSGAYAGFVSWWEGPIFVSDAFSVQTEEKQLLPKYCFHWLRSKQSEIHNLKSGGGVPHVYAKDVGRLRIPVPPIEVQREIVRILDAFSALEAELEAELEARKQQYEHYRYELLNPTKKYPEVLLQDVADFFNAKAHEKLVHPEGTVALMTARFISRGEANRYVLPEDVLTPAFIGDVALVMSDLPNGRALARTFFVDADGKYAANQRVCLLRTRDSEQLSPRYLHYIMNRNKQLLAYDSGFDQTHLKKDYILKVRLELPPIEEQHRIVSILDKFDALVNDLSIGLPAELAARRKQYEHYRDRLLTFEELSA